MAATLAVMGRSQIYGDQQELDSAALLFNLDHTLVAFGESIHFLAEIEPACTDRLARHHRPATGKPAQVTRLVLDRRDGLRTRA